MSALEGAPRALSSPIFARNKKRLFPVKIKCGNVYSLLSFSLLFLSFLSVATSSFVRRADLTTSLARGVHRVDLGLILPRPPVPSRDNGALQLERRTELRLA